MGRTFLYQDDLGQPFKTNNFFLALLKNERNGEKVGWQEANLISSLCENGMHSPVIDLDVPHKVLPSSTPGHSHLYLNVEIPWWRFVALLTGMYIAKVIEPGFFWWSLRRRASHLRVPWVSK